MRIIEMEDERKNIKQDYEEFMRKKKIEEEKAKKKR